MSGVECYTCRRRPSLVFFEYRRDSAIAFRIQSCCETQNHSHNEDPPEQKGKEIPFGLHKRSLPDRLGWRPERGGVRVLQQRRSELHWAIGNAGSHGVHQRPGILELSSTLQTDLVGTFLDCEHSTSPAVTTPEGELENRKQWIHKSSARCRRWQVPWISSQSSSVLTLVRARAIEQSAAP